MYRSSLLLLLFVLSAVFASATHNRGGVITYTNPTSLTYDFQVITYTKTSSPADRQQLVLSYGDGMMDSVTRDSIFYIPNLDLQINYYNQSHTYQSGGFYDVTMIDPNRSGGILNLPNSINQEFALKCELVVSAIGTNNSVYFDEHPIVITGTNIDYQFNPTPIDVEGDSLHFELITPLATNAQPIAGFTNPAGASINPVSGEIKLHPTTQGEYTLAVKISEYRGGTFVGSTILDYNFVATNMSSMPMFNGADLWPTNVAGDIVFMVNPGDTLDLEVGFIDNGSFGYDLGIFSETFILGSDPATSQVLPGSATIFGYFDWIPNSSHVRNHPYVVTFRGVGYENGQLRRYDLTVQIYVGVTPTSIQEQSVAANNVRLFPNPSSNQTYLEFDETPKNATFTLYDSQGKLVRRVENINERRFRLERLSEAPGIYYYEVNPGDGTLQSGKLVIQ